MQETQRRVDRRVLRTKRAIRNAFAALLSQKDIDDITVRELAEAADISRKTFYNYYTGVYEVLDEIENEISNAFCHALANMDFQNDMRDPYRTLQLLSGIIQTDPDFYGHLMRIRRNSTLADKIFTTLKASIKASLQNRSDLDDEQTNIILDYALWGMLAVYRNWYNCPNSMTFEQICNAISLLTFHGVDGYLHGVPSP
jgi:AcrR family transcriptional regulator